MRRDCLVHCDGSAGFKTLDPVSEKDLSRVHHRIEDPKGDIAGPRKE